MQDALVVNRREARAQLSSDLHSFVSWQAPDAPKQRLEILAIHVFHGEEVLTFGFAHVVDPTDVWMRHLAREADLVEQAIELLRVAVEMLGKELQCDRLAEFEVVGAIDLAHSAAAQEPDDSVALRENRAWEKPRGLCRDWGDLHAREGL
jgi:hypothetical protein